MKVIKEGIDNFENVDAQAVVTAPTGDAVETSKEKEDELEKITKAQDKPFTGGDKQPQPKKIEFPKITLEEDLFVDVNRRLNEEFSDALWQKFPTSVKDRLNDFWDRSCSNNVFKPYLTALVDVDVINEDEMMELLQSNIEDGFADRIDEADGRQMSQLKDLDDTDDPEEEMGLWTRVYAELVRNSADAAWYASQHKKVPSKISARYDHVDPASGNDLKVYGDDNAIIEEDGTLFVNPTGRLAHAQKVADAYGLTYTIGKVNKLQATPEESTYMVIHIPDPDRIVEGVDRLFDTVDNVVDDVGDVAKTAVGPDGAVSNLTKDVGELAGAVATVAPLLADAESEAEEMEEEEVDEGLVAGKIAKGFEKAGDIVGTGLDILGKIDHAVGGHVKIGDSPKVKKATDAIKDLSTDEIEELKKVLSGNK